MEQNSDYVWTASSDGESIFWRVTDRHTGRVGEGYSRDEAVAMTQRPLGPGDCPSCGRHVDYLDMEAGVVAHTALGTWVGLAKDVPHSSLSSAVTKMEPAPTLNQYTLQPCGDVLPWSIVEPVYEHLRNRATR